MSKTYLITLTPTGKFFFGGDTVFSAPGIKEDYTSYIIRSNKFPQQTSLLGMLRFLVLRNDSSVFDSAAQTITKREDASKLIGSRSFVASGELGDFGKIKRIYPCFIQKNKDGKWEDMSLKPKDAPLGVDFSNCVNAVINDKPVKLPIMSYDPKRYYEPEYVCSSCGKETKESEIFDEDVCNGINRDIITGQTEDNALFKQISYRMKGGFRFAFYAEVELDELINYNGQTVQVGGDNSQFVIGIEEKAILQEKECEGVRVVLLSPAYLETTELEIVQFAITDAIPFKCMKTETNTVQSYNKRNQLYGYSKGMSLYSTGSVFYFNSHQEAKVFTQRLKSHADFYQIGYNHYQVN